MSLEPALQIHDFQIHQRHNIANLGAKSGKTQYGKSQQSREDGKGKKGGEDGEGKRCRENHRENKINLVVKDNSGFEASMYHHIIYKC